MSREARTAVAKERRDRRTPAATSMRGLQVARWLLAVPLVTPVLLCISLIFNTSKLLPIAYSLTFAGVGISLLMLNLGARRAGLLHGALRWLGSVTGVAYVLAGIGFATLLFGIGATLYLIGYNILELGQTLYIAWAIWTGVKLSRAQATTPAAVASATR